VFAKLAAVVGALGRDPLAELVLAARWADPSTAPGQVHAAREATYP